MKKSILILLALALVLALVSCGASAVGGTSEPAGAPDGSGSAGLADASQPEADHDHQLAQADNIVPHDPAGYCGNTVTKIRPEPRMSSEDWEASFWGDDSVALTDLLLYLDYQEGICRCLPEYMVKTEFGETEYGINLTEGYARYGDSQVELTQEQVDLVQGILDRNLPGPQDD